jgi:hypothetical protein
MLRTTCQRTFGTFTSSDTLADASACKRAKFLPAHRYNDKGEYVRKKFILADLI